MKLLTLLNKFLLSIPSMRRKSKTDDKMWHRKVFIGHKFPNGGKDVPCGFTDKVEFKSY